MFYPNISVIILLLIRCLYFCHVLKKKLYNSDCSTDAFVVAEEKIKYLRQQNVKQAKLNL